MIKTIRIGILLTAAVLLAWLLPWIYSFVCAAPGQSSFTLYSCVTHTFASTGFDEQGKFQGRDFEGNTYTDRQFDSILPLFYCRQLAAEGRFPAEIEGVALDLRTVERSKFFFRSSPAEINRRHPTLHQLLESMPARLDLEAPEDVFRITGDGIEFVTMETNSVDRAKSDAFTSVMRNKGFVFPARSVGGNPTTRKEYDNGWLLVDGTSHLFHLKQMCGRPYVRRIELPEGVEVDCLFVTEFSDRKLLGLLTDRANRLYALDADGYALHELSVGRFDPRTDHLLIVGDLLYWTVKIQSAAGERLTAVDARDYSAVDSFGTPALPEAWERRAAWIFPFELSFTSPSDGYVQPRISACSGRALLLGALLALLYARIRRRSLRTRWWSLAGILLFGIYLFVPLLATERR